MKTVNFTEMKKGTKDEYLLLDAYPLMRSPIGWILLNAIHKNIPIPTLLINKFWPKGTISQERITGTKTNIGPAVNRIESALAGIISSFTSNLRPSAIGWSTPSAPAYSGPILCWAAADIFLSSQTVTNYMSDFTWKA